MLKRMTLLARRTDKSFDEFSRYWWENHGKIVTRMPSVYGYVQNPIKTRLLNALNADNPFSFDGIVELWFENEDAQKIAFASNAAKELPLDEPNFIRAITIYAVNDTSNDRVVVDNKVMLVARLGDGQSEDEAKVTEFVRRLSTVAGDYVRVVNRLSKAGWRDTLSHEPSPPNVIVELTFAQRAEMETLATSNTMQALHAEIVRDGGAMECYLVEPRRVV